MTRSVLRAEVGQRCSGQSSSLRSVSQKVVATPGKPQGWSVGNVAKPHDDPNGHCVVDPTSTCSALAQLGDNIRQARLDRGHSQVAVANACGISKSRFCTLEAGEHEPGAFMLMRIADVLGVSIEHLLNGCRDPVCRHVVRTWDTSTGRETCCSCGALVVQDRRAQ